MLILQKVDFCKYTVTFNVCIIHNGAAILHVRGRRLHVHVHVRGRRLHVHVRGRRLHIRVHVHVTRIPLFQFVIQQLFQVVLPFYLIYDQLHITTITPVYPVLSEKYTCTCMNMNCQEFMKKVWGQLEVLEDVLKHKVKCFILCLV